MSGSVGTSPVVTTLTVAGLPDLQRDLGAAANLLNSYVRANESASRALAATGQQATQAGSGFRGFGQALGSAGYQVQDFAVQVQAGTSALTALSQQGSQFLGVFGTGGAIAGAVLTVGILAAQLLGLRDNTEAVKAANEGWTDQLKKLNELMETSAQRAARLRSEMVQGGRTFALQQMQQSEYEAERAGAQGLRLQENIRSLARQTARLNPRLDPNGVNANVNEILTLTEELRFARSRASAATGGVAAARRLLEQFQEQGERGGGAEKPKPTTERARGGGGPTPDQQELTAVWQTISRALKDVDEAAGAAGSSYEQLIRTLDPAEGAAAKYEERLRTLTNAQSFGVITSEEFARGLSLITKAFDQDIARITRGADDLAGVGREFATVFTSAFDGLTTKAKSFADVLQGLGLGIARILERQFITKPLESGLSELLKGQTLSGLFSSATSYLFGSGGATTGTRAGGGPVMAGAGYLVGETGPELFVPNVAGQIVPNGGMGGGIFIDARGAEQGVEARIDAVLARRLPQIVAATRSDITARVNRGGADARTFGRR